MKKKSIFSLLCLLLSIVLVGCANNAKDNGEDTNPIKITAPVDIEADSTDEASESDTVFDTESSLETEVETDPETESADETEEVPNETQPTFDIDNVPYIEGMDNVFDLYEALSAGAPIKGEFVSKESDKLVMVVGFECHAESDGAVTVKLDVGLDTYAISCNERLNTGEITINGVTHTFSNAALSHDGAAKVYLPLTTYTYQVAPEETSCLIDVSWSFMGVYGGEVIDDLTASALLTWVIAADN